MLQVRCSCVDIVADTYQQNSLDSERGKCGAADKVIVKSSQSKIPRKFVVFLKNGDNKTRLIEILKDEFVANRSALFDKLNCQQILFSMDKLCYKSADSDVVVVEELSGNQEEADTKLLLHVKHALDDSDNASVIVRSLSGDGDVLFLGMFTIQPDQIFVDYRSGKSR